MTAIPEHTIYQVSSFDLEAVQVFIDKFIDHVCDAQHGGTDALTALDELQGALSNIQTSAIERETGA